MRYHLYFLKGNADEIGYTDATGVYRFCYNTRMKAVGIIESIYGRHLNMLDSGQIGLTVYQPAGVNYFNKYAFIVSEKHPIFNLYMAAVSPAFLPREWSRPEIPYLVLTNLVKTFKK